MRVHYNHILSFSSYPLLYGFLHILQVRGLPVLLHIQSFAVSHCHASARITPFVVNLLDSVESHHIWERGPVEAFLEKVPNARDSIGW